MRANAFQLMFLNGSQAHIPSENRIQTLAGVRKVVAPVYILGLDSGGKPPRCLRFVEMTMSLWWSTYISSTPRLNVFRARRETGRWNSGHEVDIGGRSVRALSRGG